MLPTHFYHNRKYHPINFQNPHHIALLGLLGAEGRGEEVGAGHIPRAAELALGKYNGPGDAPYPRMFTGDPSLGNIEEVSRHQLGRDQLKRGLDESTQDPPPEVFL